jgi:ADP-ribose pyrophosphatase
MSCLDFAKGECILPITNDHKEICLRQYRHAIMDSFYELAWSLTNVEDTLTKMRAG